MNTVLCSNSNNNEANVDACSNYASNTFNAYRDHQFELETYIECIQYNGEMGKIVVVPQPKIETISNNMIHFHQLT